MSQPFLSLARRELGRAEINERIVCYDCFEMKREIPNPNGRAGKPIIVPNMSLDDALKKILAAPPESKPEKPKRKTVKEKK